ncbi:MAG: carboxypeptidase-like regulatory domain-containing protein [Flavobacteriales bacterium]|nr:carboxypeptidase-like regulatory domain-containing protein [Flavobacteriales bacterium]MCB9203745.1 carboxypeptidase-like regulatory domain-containing protein [Flavobacteriales bacterium]
MNIPLFFLAFVTFSSTVFAQRTTTIFGTVTDLETHQPLPFANVVFQNSSVGTLTDSLGNFKLETKRNFDSLVVSLIGYKSQTLVVNRGVTEELAIQLVPSSYELGMVEVRPGENPAFKILRKVIANKPKNTPESLNYYEYEAYHRVQFDLNNFTEKIKKNLFLRPFDYMWENTDTTEDGINYLPMLLTESSEEHFYRKQPRSKKEVVKGRRTFKFFQAPKIMEFVNDMYVDPNIYENYVTILDRSFPSPINDYYKRNYNFLLDSGIHVIDGHPCHHIFFKPKGKSDVAFTGDMYIDTSHYAVVQTDLEFSVEANINFVRNYWIQQKYSFVDSTQWFLTSSRVIGDFTVIENAKDMTGFFGKKTTDIRNIKINEPRDAEYYATVDPIVIEDSAYVRDDAFWNEARRDTFSTEQQNLVNMIDRMNNDPKWKLLIGGIKLLADGWIPFRQIDIGHIYSFYTWNPIEQSRVKFGFRTNDKFSDQVKLSGYLAYGIGDNRFKGGGSAEFIFPGELRRRWVLGVSYKNDQFQQGMSQNVIALDHIFRSFGQISGEQRRTMLESYNTYIERQWFTGLSTRISMFRDRYSPLQQDFRVRSGLDTLNAENFTAAGAKFNLRFGFGEDELPATFDQVDRGFFFRKYPMISFEVAVGIKDFLNSNFNYQHYKLKLEYQLKANKAGYLNILAEGGIINGKLPYQLLHVPDGNPLVFNDDHGFNLMNYMEFVSDKYVSLQLEHHFNGLLFNLIPGVRLAKLRSLLIGKIYFGTLTDQNRNGNFLLADGMEVMQHPYAEVGFGIENILKISRIDFTWRLTQLDNSKTLGFIVKPSFYFRF